MQLNLIIVFCGVFLALQLQHIGRIIKFQTTEWNVENKDWKTDDSDDMFYQIDAKENKKI
jgi:hypothetical protein